MTTVAIVAAVWLLLAFVVGLFVGRAIHLMGKDCINGTEMGCRCRRNRRSDVG